MLGFITNRLLNALNVTYAPYASCKALMSVTPDDDIKWCERDLFFFLFRVYVCREKLNKTGNQICFFPKFLVCL
jgi:hypothetical protein